MIDYVIACEDIDCSVEPGLGILEFKLSLNCLQLRRYTLKPSSETVDHLPALNLAQEQLIWFPPKVAELPYSH